MATTKEKQDALIDLIGAAWTEFVLNQADLTEKEGDRRGLKYKERSSPAGAFNAAPPYINNPANGIGAIIRNE